MREKDREVLFMSITEHVGLGPSATQRPCPAALTGGDSHSAADICVNSVS